MKNDLIKPIMIGVALAIAVTCLLAGLALVFKSRLIAAPGYRPAVITKLAVPTVTPTRITPTSGPQLTPIVSSGEVAIDNYVQIVNTGGVGLRIRPLPGIDSTPKFIAKENEVFMVRDGPMMVDDITWWLLVASYDENRQGWAAGQYLAVINQP